MAAISDQHISAPHHFGLFEYSQSTNRGNRDVRHKTFQFGVDVEETLACMIGRETAAESFFIHLMCSSQKLSLSKGRSNTRSRSKGLIVF